MAGKNTNKIIIQLLAISIVTILFWIGLEVYHVSSKKNLPDIPEEILEPLDPTLDQKELNKIQDRLTPTEDDLNKIPQERKIKFESSEASPTAEPKKP